MDQIIAEPDPVDCSILHTSPRRSRSGFRRSANSSKGIAAWFQMGCDAVPWNAPPKSRKAFQMGDKLPLGSEMDFDRKIEHPQNSDRQRRRFLDELSYWLRTPGKHSTVSKDVKGKLHYRRLKGVADELPSCVAPTAPQRFKELLLASHISARTVARADTPRADSLCIHSQSATIVQLVEATVAPINPLDELTKRGPASQIGNSGLGTNAL